MHLVLFHINISVFNIGNKWVSKWEEVMDVIVLVIDFILGIFKNLCHLYTSKINTITTIMDTIPI